MCDVLLPSSSLTLIPSLTNFGNLLIVDSNSHSFGIRYSQNVEEDFQKERILNQTKQNTMKDKYSEANTGPDHYFDEALQYPSLSSYSLPFSKSSGQSNHRFVLLPSSLRSKYDYDQYSSPARSTLWYHSRSHEFVSAPTHSPGSHSTSKTSLCSDYDYDDDENDEVESHCGSLTYSVESWTIGDAYPHDEVDADEIDDGYHAEDDDTIYTNDICRSAYRIDHEDDCFGADVCFPPLDWFNARIKETFQVLGAIPEEEATRERSQLRPINLYQTIGPA